MDDPTPTTSGGGFGGPPSSGNVKIPYKVKNLIIYTFYKFILI